MYRRSRIVLFAPSLGLTSLLTVFLLLGGCAIPKAKDERALSNYQTCIATGASAVSCSEEYWRQSNDASTRERTKPSREASKKVGNTLIMGIICSQTPNASACISGAADALSDKKSSTNLNEERLKRAEKRANDLEQTLRNQCALRGGFYNSFTGCNR